MKPTVLLYNLDGEKGSKLRVVCMYHKLKLRPVQPEEYGQPLEALLGLAPAAEPAPSAATPFADEMLVFCGVDDRQLSDFLQTLRSQRLGVALKAVLTETNRTWSSSALHTELLEEHATMQQRSAHE